MLYKVGWQHFEHDSVESDEWHLVFAARPRKAAETHARYLANKRQGLFIGKVVVQSPNGRVRSYDCREQPTAPGVIS